MSHDKNFLAELETCERLTGDALQALEREYGFRFRSILCAIMHLALWTRPDILPSATFLSMYQAAPGKAHFEALKGIVLYLRNNPDLPLVFKKTKTKPHSPSIVASITMTSSCKNNLGDCSGENVSNRGRRYSECCFSFVSFRIRFLHCLVMIDRSVSWSPDQGVVTQKAKREKGRAP